MRIVRRFVFTAAFLIAAVLMIRAAKLYGDFLFLFYPGIMREVQVILSEITGKLDYLLWERIALVALIWAVVTLLLDIILQENLLRWVSGITAAAAFLLCLFVAAYGLNYYAPSVAEGMRLEVSDEYSRDELKQAAVYYRDEANSAARTVNRDAQGLFDSADFQTLADEVGSGMKNRIRESYLFGGSYTAPKELGYLSKFDVSAFYSCFTGECCVNSNMMDITLPFLMSVETAHRMSIARDGDAAFIAIAACTASDSEDYRYSGSFMAYRFCLEALRSMDETAADEVAEGESDELKLDLAACDYMPTVSLGARWLPAVEKLDKKQAAPQTDEEAAGEADQSTAEEGQTDQSAAEETQAEPPDIASLLVAWQIRLTTPAETAA